MSADVGDIRMKSQGQSDDVRMVIPSVRVKCRTPDTYVYEPLESASADFLVP